MKINYKKILANFYDGFNTYGKIMATQYDGYTITNVKVKNKNK